MHFTMEHSMRPKRFANDSESGAKDKRWTRRFETFTNFIETLLHENPNRPINKRAFQTNYVPHSINIIANCESYEEAIERLLATYKKKKMNYLLDMYLPLGDRKPAKHYTIF